MPLSVRKNWQAWSALLQRANYFASTYSILAMSDKPLTFVLHCGSKAAFGGFCIVLWPLQCVLRASSSRRGAQSHWILRVLVVLGVFVPFVLVARWPCGALEMRLGRLVCILGAQRAAGGACPVSHSWSSSALLSISPSGL